MKKYISKKYSLLTLMLLIISFFTVTNQVMAKDAVASCRTSGFIAYKSEVVASIHCSLSTGDIECMDDLKKSIKQKYGAAGYYFAHREMCHKVKGMDWYPDSVYIKY